MLALYWIEGCGNLRGVGVLSWWVLQFDAEIFADSLDKVRGRHNKRNLHHLA